MPALSSYTTVTPIITDKVSGVKADGTVQNYTVPSLIADIAGIRRTLLDVSGSHIAARAAGTYWMSQGQAMGVTGVGTLYPPDVIRLASTDFPALFGLTAKLSIRMNVAVNDVAPTGNYTFGIYPVTRPATSGGAGLVIYTMGTVVSGSTVTLTAPAADSHTALVGPEVAMPADGFYVVGMVSTAAVATSSHMHMSGRLIVRYT